MRTAFAISERRSVDDVHRDRLIQIHPRFLASGEHFVEEINRLVFLCGQQGIAEIKRVREPDTAMAVGPPLMGEEMLGRGIVQIDVVLVGEHVLHQTKGVAVEVNSETDFVGKNAEFQTMVAGIAKVAMNAADVDALLAADMGGKSVKDVLVDKIATIGENMSVRRMAALEGSTVVSYVHNAAADGMGKIGVLVALTGDEAFGKQVAMHIAATNPASLDEASLDPAVVEKEKQIQIDIARESGKPEQVIEKMMVGRMKKFMAEVTLLGQAFVINPDLTVAAAAKEAGAEITGYVRLEVGEGSEKKEEDFAAEVAKTAAGG